MTSTPRTEQVVVRVRLNNERTKTCTFAVEPWGDTYEMKPGESFDVVASGPAENCQLEIDQSDESVVVYGWSGSTVSIFHDDKELGAGASAREPAP